MHPQPQPPSLKYRADIDGLRALAVIPVILFHLQLGAPGGFIGVDIFFVISGYLITSIISKDLAKGQFSMPYFWERRIRRIFPALACVVFFTIVVGAFVLFPRQFAKLGKEILAQSLLSSNIYFWRQDGYFAAPSEYQALLHTWSLAVEEQFYLFFPLLLVYLNRSKQNLLKWSVGLMTLSFLWSIYGVHAHPNATFFLLPARAWELLLGASIALFHYKKTWRHSLNEAMSWLALALIFIPITLYDSDTSFPGPAALPPCLGAALLIFCNHQRITTPGKILSAPPLVFVGKISYSLYLWHWPIIVYTQYASIYELSTATRIILFLASFIAAYLSWKFVETPFRAGGAGTMLPTRKHTFRTFYAVTSILLVIGAVLYLTKGAAFRFSEQTLDYIATAKERNKLEDPSPITDTQKLPLLISGPEQPPVQPVLLWGDSHAQCITPLMTKLCLNHQLNIHIAARSGTPPILNTTCPPQQQVTEFNHAVFNYIERKKIKNVILVSHWNDYALGTQGVPHSSRLKSSLHPGQKPKKVFASHLTDTVNQLKTIGVNVWILKQPPEQHLYAPKALANAHRFGIDKKQLGVSVEEHQLRQTYVNQVLHSLESETVHILDPMPYLVNEAHLCIMEKDGHSLYRDTNHLSRYGALLLAPLFDPVFKTFMNEKAPPSR